MAATPEHAARVLGLDLDTTVEIVRQRRRRLALRYHPDRAPDPERSARHMARINAAADTLIAHLQAQKAAQAKWRRPDYQDFAARRRAAAGRAKSKSTGPRAKPQAKAANDPGPKAERAKRPDPKPQAAEPKAKAETRSKAELALIRLATASYRTVLERISGAETGPSIDVQALRFARAA